MLNVNILSLIVALREFPVGVVTALRFYCSGRGFNSWSGNEDLA